MNNIKECEEKETFGSNVGEGIGCFLILVGIAILISAPGIISLLLEIFKK